MHWQYTPYVLPLFIAVAVSATFALYAWRHRSVLGAEPCTLLLLAVAEWSLGYALELGSADLSSKLFWGKIASLGVVIVPVAWLAFVLQYTGLEKWLTRRNVALLAVVPLVTLLLVWTNESHLLYYSDIRLTTSGPLSVLDFTYGVWFWVDIAYSYLLTLLGTLLLLRTFVRSPRLYRGQAGALLIGTFIPWVAEVLLISDLSPLAPLDLTPFAFVLAGLVFAWGLFRFRLLDIVPVAREAVIEGMNDGLIVLDVQNRIVDLNPAAGRIIGRPASEVIGQPITIADWGLRIADLEQVFHSEIHIPQSAITFDLCLSPMHDRRGRFTGRLVVLRDITERQQAEEALKESLEKVEQAKQEWESTADSLPSLVCLLDHRGHIIRANRTVETWNLGRVGDVKGRGMHELFHPGCTDAACYLGAFWSRAWEELAQGQPAECEAKDKILKRHLSVQVRPILAQTDGEGKKAASFAVAVVDDITERKQAEEALWESEKRLRTVVTGAPIVLFATDHEGVLTLLEGRGLEALGLQPGEVIGRAVFDVLQGAPQVGEDIRRALSGKTFTSVRELAGRMFETWHSPLRDQNGEITGVIGVATDITERLLESEKRLHAVATGVPIIIFATDREGVITLADGQGLETLGLKPGEVIGRPVFDVLQDVPQVDEGFRRTLAGEEPVLTAEVAGRTFDIRLSPLRDQDGKIAGVTGVATDITERKQAEEALQESRALLERSHQTLTERVAALETLHRIGVAISSQLETDALLQFILEQAAMLMGAAGCSILLPDEATGELVFHAADVPIVGMRLPPGRGIAARALRECTPQVAHDVTTDPDHYVRVGQESSVPTHSLLAVPLLVGDKAIGVLEAINKQQGRFSKQDRDLLMTMANHAAIAIENARLYEQAQQEITRRKRAEKALEELNATLEERVRRRTFDLQVLHNLAQEIGHIRDFDELVRLMLGSLHQAMSHDVSAGFLMRGDQYELFIHPTRPLAPTVQEEIQERLVSTFIRMSGKEAIREQERLSIQTLEPEGFDAARPPVVHLGSVFQVPLIVGQEGRVEGLLFIGAEQEEAFTEDQVRLLYTMANQTSLFLSIRRSEEALRESETRYRAIVEDQTELICRCLPDGTLTFVNEAYCRYFDKKREELIGHSFMPFIPEEDREVVHQQFSSLGPENLAVTYEHRVVAPNGEMRWQQWTDRAIFDDQGRFSKFQAVGQDITERKRAEEALHYRLEFDRLVTNISTLFIQLDPDDLDSGIDFALHAIGQFTAVDRSYIFVFSDDGTKMGSPHEWCAEGIASQMESRQELPVQRFPWWMQRLHRLEAVHIPRVADLPSEAKGEKEFLESQNVQSLVAVPMVYSTSLVGFVGFDSVRAEKTWTEDIISLLKIVGEIFVNALERKRAEEQIRATLQEKEVLLKEIHHRVKNNLQIISSLLDLQSGYIEDEQTRQLFQESRNRVKSMALIHERLYQTQDLARVDFAEYIQSLARDVFRSYRAHAAGVTLKANIESVFLGIDTAIPCGLIINELVSNALKYAFPDSRRGEICVELFPDNGQFTLVVRDNGVGFPKDLDFRKTESLGLKLVITLVRQLKGTIELDSDGGTEFKIEFAALERKRRE